jgi:hypothetical protein
LKLKQLSRNIHQLIIDYDYTNNRKHEVLMLSDIHWDNPHCKRDILKKHLDHAKENKIPVFINGDFFCLMQGKYDPRKRKNNIRPEHNLDNYLDAVITDAVKWWTPYKNILTVIGYGNHETSILSHQETDPLQRFVDLFNYQNKTNIYTGGYGGWLLLTFRHTKGKATKTYKIKYYHGSGGGGPVTKGTIQNNRMMAMVQGADCIAMGHVHELYALYYKVETLNQRNIIELKNVLHLRTGTYKEEYADGYMDYHIERGRPPKPVGCFKLQIECVYDKTTDHKQTLIATATTMI